MSITIETLLFMLCSCVSSHSQSTATPQHQPYPQRLFFSGLRGIASRGNSPLPSSVRHAPCLVERGWSTEVLGDHLGKKWIDSFSGAARDVPFSTLDASAVHISLLSRSGGTKILIQHSSTASEVPMWHVQSRTCEVHSSPAPPLLQPGMHL